MLSDKKENPFGWELHNDCDILFDIEIKIISIEASLDSCENDINHFIVS